jgi:hypothetical protein
MCLNALSRPCVATHRRATEFGVDEEEEAAWQPSGDAMTNVPAARILILSLLEQVEGVFAQTVV